VNNWETANTVTFDLTPLSFQTYQFIWQVVNNDPPKEREASSVNPGGFLAEIITQEPMFKGNFLSSSLWEVAFQNNLSQPGDFNSLAWSEAKEYGANNDSGGIWNQAHEGSIEGIGGTAQWIWTAANFGDPGAPSMNDSVFIRTTVNDPPIPTPEPSTLLLISSGLMSLVAFKKKLIK
jgi:PEP-CTERM motif